MLLIKLQMNSKLAQQHSMAQDLSPKVIPGGSFPSSAWASVYNPSLLEF